MRSRSRAPKLTGPKPRIWKEKVGLVEVDQAIAADQIVELSPEVKPAPRSEPLRYEWRVTAGTCSISNPASKDARITCSETGTAEATIAVKDKNDVELGKGKGGFTVSISRETIKQSKDKADAAAKEGKQAQEAAQKLQNAKDLARKGKLDEAIKEAEEADKLNSANKEAKNYADQLKKEKEIVQAQLDKTKRLIDESKFADAQKELIVAKNLHGSYAPVMETDKLLGDKWNAYSTEMRDKLYGVRSLNERKEFKKALEQAENLRKTTKISGYDDEQLKQQENWARQWEAEKEKKRQTFKAAADKLRAYDYQGSLKSFDEGFANAGNVFNGSEPEYIEANKLREEAYAKNKQLMELLPWVKRAAEDTQSSLPPEGLQNALKFSDQAIALQPTNEQIKKWRAAIEAKLAKTTSDNERVTQGRKYLEAAGNAERSFANNESYVKANPGQWGEKLEEQQQTYLTTAIQNYTESLKYIPDASVEKKIKDLQATLEARKKYLEQYRTSRTLLAEADALYKQATQDPDIQSASPKYDEAAAKYRKSLSLYRPFNAENIEKTISVLELNKHERWVKKYWADGQELEKQGKLVEALAAYDKAIASLHPTTDQRSRLWYETYAQEIRNKINGAKQLRAQGEAQQKQGKIPDAIASYRQSLKLVPDKALEDHVKAARGRIRKGQ